MSLLTHPAASSLLAATPDVQLTDPDKHISRKHLTVRQGADGVELRVTSALNGVQTSSGRVEAGQCQSLRNGDHFTLGAYRIEVRGAGASSHEFGSARMTDPPPMPMSTARGDDPFATLFAPRASTPEIDGGDPFSRPAFLPAPVGQRLAGGVAPEPWGGPSQRLNDWLVGTAPASWAPWSAPTAGTDLTATGPFDAFLGRPTSEPATRSFSPDHVHGIHLPMALACAPAQTVLERSADRAPVVRALPAPAAGPQADIWAGLFDAPAPAHGDVNGLVDDASRDDPFDDWDDALSSDPVAVPAVATTTDATDVTATVTSPATLVKSATPVEPDPLDAWAAFTRGLGLPAPHDPCHNGDPHATRAAHAEQAGAIVRTLIEALALLLAARADLKRELRAPDLTMLAGHDNNPLKAGLAAPELIQYLFATDRVGGFLPAGRAVRECIDDLLVHQLATIAATRAAVEGTVREFDPLRLRKLRAKGSASPFRVLDSARLWETYELQHQTQSAQMADWLEALFARHFMPAYSRETERLKRESKAV